MKSRSRGANNTTPPYATARAALEHAVYHKATVRIFYGDAETGVDDCNETWRVGMVKRTSLGVFTLIVPHSRKAVLHEIALRDVVRVRKGRRDLYRHKNYNTGTWTWRYNEKLGRWTAMRNDLIHATFDNEIRAAAYCAYITGDLQRPFGFPFPETTYRKIVKRSTKIEDTSYYQGVLSASK